MYLCSTNPRATICLFCVPLASEFCMRKLFLQFMYHVSTRTYEVNCRIVYLCIRKYEYDCEIGLHASAQIEGACYDVQHVHIMFKGICNSVTIQMVLF
jgi:hypothetical protein